jgi:glycerol-1-phosphate dehydrogenase [NAD(P)+]
MCIIINVHGMGSIPTSNRHDIETRMIAKTNLSDPTDLAGLRRYLVKADTQGKLAPLDINAVVISDTAHLDVARHVDQLLTAKSKIVLLTDKSPIKRGQERLSTIVATQLHHHDVRHAILDDGNATLHADEKTLDKAAAAVAGADLVVTIGSGTMTDVGKVATHRNGNIPHVVVQTAASVDGFTDNVSVVLRNGVKRTIASRWPTVVLADTVTIANAPRDLNTSGFGEAISLFTAPADWYLANLVGLDNTYHPASMELLKAAAATPPDWSAGVARGDAAAMQKLTSLLALRGIVSGISNTTACLSGVEHVVSHMLDLHHAALHKPIGLHGAQVGVASLVASKLWRHVVEHDFINVKRLKVPDATIMERRVRAAFEHLDGAIAGECWLDCKKKLRLLADNWPRLIEVLEDWSTHRKEIRKMVQPAEKLRLALGASGSPATFGDLSPSISPQLARWAVANCHLMRNRFNLVDLLDLLGLWTDDLIDWALEDVMPVRTRGAA